MLSLDRVCLARAYATGKSAEIVWFSSGGPNRTAFVLSNPAAYAPIACECPHLGSKPIPDLAHAQCPAREPHPYFEGRGVRFTGGTRHPIRDSLFSAPRVWD